MSSSNGPMSSSTMSNHSSASAPPHSSSSLTSAALPSSSSRLSWSTLRSIVREHKRMITLYRYPMHFAFRSFKDILRTRIYFLSSQCGKEQSLLYVDIDDSNPYSTSTISLPWNSLFETTFQMFTSGGKLSKEEQLMSERKRVVPWGINQFELHEESGKFLFPAAGSLFSCLDTGSGHGPVFPSELKTTTCRKARLNATMCPVNPNLIAFVAHGDIWVCHSVTGEEVRLTYVHQGHESLEDDPLSAGLPSYVMQEEFARYSGFWWRPQCLDGKYAILYEEVDESGVDLIKFPMGNTGEVEEFRFPRPGKSNAISVLKMMTFSLNSDEEIVNIRDNEIKGGLKLLFPWAEYIVRVGWMPDGESLWAQLLDRRQKHLELIMVSADLFTPVFEDHMDDSNGSSMTNILGTMAQLSSCHTLLRVSSDKWIGVNDVLAFLPAEPGQVKFIWASEESGWRHLYLITSQVLTGSAATNKCSISSEIKGVFESKILSKLALTSGQWSVLNKEVWVDTGRDLVYFHGLKDTPLEKHLYVVSMSQPEHIRRLTKLGYSHSVHMNQECSMFVTVFSSVQSVPACQVFRISHADSTVDGVTVTPCGSIVEEKAPDRDYQPPEIFEHAIASGDTIFGMIFKPTNMKPGEKYPVVVSVYGGPEVQLVTNTYKGIRQMRNHLLASQGYCVICIDSRGSHNRGTSFESHIRLRMGQVEMKDQVEVLLWLAETKKYLDLKRVAIHGWSYGGYLSLMGLIQYPNLFKVAVAGAPVVTWANYDTGYTERYMDLPSFNNSGYALGSVLARANDLPDEPNRLLIVHGLMDENVHFFHHTSLLISHMIKYGKPYELQVYPGERHSLRQYEASEHFEMTLLNFLQCNL